jgi:hypothetical protein
MTAKNIDTQEKTDNQEMVVEPVKSLSNKEMEEYLEKTKEGMLNAIAFVNRQR